MCVRRSTVEEGNFRVRQSRTHDGESRRGPSRARSRPVVLAGRGVDRTRTADRPRRSGGRRGPGGRPGGAGCSGSRAAGPARRSDHPLWTAGPGGRGAGPRCGRTRPGGPHEAGRVRDDRRWPGGGMCGGSGPAVGSAAAGGAAAGGMAAGGPADVRRERDGVPDGARVGRWWEHGRRVGRTRVVRWRAPHAVAAQPGRARSCPAPPRPDPRRVRAIRAVVPGGDRAP